METAKDVRYPRQIYTVGRENLVLGIDNYLSAPNDKDTIPPLELHSAFSRFVITIIDKSGEKTSWPKANIPAGDVPGILEIAKVAMINKSRFLSEGKQQETDLPAAYTQTISVGSFKGKTPAAILLENPANKATLIKTRDFLARKVSQYPNNQNQIDAINNAVELLDKGQLEEENVEARRADMAKIYDVCFKYMSTTNEKGHRLFYSMSIICRYTNNYPWEITIENFFAPSTKGPKGGLVPIIDEKSGTSKSTFYINDMEWCQLAAQMEAALRYFESSVYAALYKEAMNIDKKHREAWRNNAESKDVA